MASEAKERFTVEQIDEKVWYVRDNVKHECGFMCIHEGVVARVAELQNKLNAAEQQLATERERHKSMAAEFEKIAKGGHPLYVMRCDVPPPVSEQEGERAKCDRCSRPVFARWCNHCAEPAHSPEHATIREQAAEIERLKGELGHEKTDSTNLRLHLKRLTPVDDEDAGNSPPAAKPETVKQEPLVECRLCGRHMWTGEQGICGECHDEAVTETSKRPGLPHNRDEKRIYGTWLTESEHNWLNRRAEVEAQLSKYKRDAEAWEAVRKHGLSVTRGHFGVSLYQAVRESYRHDDNRSSYGDPADAVLTFAASLSQQEGT